METIGKIDEIKLKLLNKEFGNLVPVCIKDKVIYVDSKNTPIFFYSKSGRNSNVFINYKKVWLFLETIFCMKYDEIKKLIKLWLVESYGLRGAITGEVFNNLVMD
jgi:hypothetical protein